MLEFLQLDFVWNALAICVVIGLLLSYLGVHVVGRGIVFVDLALGQISMLGVAFAKFIDSDPTVISIAFTLVGAFLLSLIKVKDTRLKQEAIIGIIYAVASAATVLFISKAAHGDADISEVLFGSFFTVTNSQILQTVIVFGAIALLHVVFRKRFFELTDWYRKDQVHEIGLFDPWNFLFYLGLGLAIVLAVRVGGVIPVFSFLVVPPVAGLLIAARRSIVLALAIVISVLGSVLGIYFSLSFDFPVGSSVVAMLGVLFAIAAGIRGVRKAR
ncbi:MAG: metal ABC transporter permease [Rhodothermales bacterium]